MNIFSNTAEAIKNILIDLDTNSQTLKVRGYETKELTNYMFTIENPKSNIFYNKEHSSKLKYIAGELLWYFSGRNDVDFISKYSSFWKNICNNDGTCNSAYGYLLFNNTPQYNWALQSLMNDIYSRQAIMHFNLPEHQYKGNKDFVCTMYANFHIRPDENDNQFLHMSVFMRSNDIIFGLINDISFFTMLHQQMHKHLVENKYSDLKLGKYTHFSNSMHIYDRHYDKANEMLKHEFIPTSLPEININLIDIMGKPTKYLNDTINQTKKYKDDLLLDFLYTNAFEK